jgi:GT2 family glycosyltransferase
VITEAGARTGETVIASGQSGAIFHELLETNFISTLTVIARKDALVALGGFDESSRMYGVEDYELWLRIAATGEPIEYVDQTLALYRRHADNMSRADELGSLKTLTHAFRATLNADLSGEQRAAVRARLYRLYLSRSNYSRGLERAKDLAAAKLYQARAGT